ncbi:hypothetical protein [Novosphingobium sp. ST904]|uniref:hypothetical protein n=1 Tax=Novosphingobium sp. ST904 TaxID=1684385 RepID=UPI000A71DD1A|nr:hypothetical protein [Novosphingobium sp. ST904]TCM40076.1 hypothetical protein EDF59_105316 [Novosphingobium sp. ST904]
MNDAERRRIFGPLRPMGEPSLAETGRSKARMRLLIAFGTALVGAMLTGSVRWIGI